MAKQKSNPTTRYGCHNIASKYCGNVIPQKNNGSLRYVKVVDGRCNNEEKGGIK